VFISFFALWSKNKGPRSLLGFPCPPLTPPGCYFGAILVPLGGPGGSLGVPWDPFWTTLGRFGPHVASIWVLFGLPCLLWGAFWCPLAPSRVISTSFLLILAYSAHLLYKLGTSWKVLFNLLISVPSCNKSFPSSWSRPREARPKTTGRAGFWASSLGHATH
jgi:hypothetical protein